jgi:hypothetical protein
MDNFIRNVILIPVLLRLVIPTEVVQTVLTYIRIMRPLSVFEIRSKDIIPVYRDLNVQIYSHIVIYLSVLKNPDND